MLTDMDAWTHRMFSLKPAVQLDALPLNSCLMIGGATIRRSASESSAHKKRYVP